MNKKLLFLSFYTFLGFGLISCNKEKNISNESQKVETTQTGTQYNVDVAESKIEWKGFKLFKSENTSHLGIIKFSNGTFTLKDGILESGKFTADMKSIENLDVTDAAMKTKLETHLKSDDFFGVEKFPTATFEITKVSSSNQGDYNNVLEGNLTIKGITKPFNIKANVVMNDGKVSIFSEPTQINREDFGVKFQSPIENGVIKNEIEIHIIIKANIQ